MLCMHVSYLWRMCTFLWTSVWESLFCLTWTTDGFAAAFLGVAAAPLPGDPVWKHKEEKSENKGGMYKHLVYSSFTCSDIWCTHIPVRDEVGRRGGRERDAGVDGRTDIGGELAEEGLRLGVGSLLSSLSLFFTSSLTYMSLHGLCVMGQISPDRLHSLSHSMHTPNGWSMPQCLYS